MSYAEANLGYGFYIPENKENPVEMFNLLSDENKKYLADIYGVDLEEYADHDDDGCSPTDEFSEEAWTDTISRFLAENYPNLVVSEVGTDSYKTDNGNRVIVARATHTCTEGIALDVMLNPEAILKSDIEALEALTGEYYENAEIGWKLWAYLG